MPELNNERNRKIVNERYLNPEHIDLDNYDTIVLKSAKGTGKTSVLGHIAKHSMQRRQKELEQIPNWANKVLNDPSLDHRSEAPRDTNYRTLVLTHRIQLAKELARRLRTICDTYCR